MERRDYGEEVNERAQEFRRTATVWEEILWKRLRKSGPRWRRQHPLHGFFLDLYCDAARLAVECDGAKHDPGYDPWRDGKIAEHGVLTLRFTNVEIGAEPDRCVEEILSVMRERIETRENPTPAPPQREGF